MLNRDDDDREANVNVVSSGDVMMPVENNDITLDELKNVIVGLGMGSLLV